MVRRWYDVGEMTDRESCESCGTRCSTALVSSASSGPGRRASSYVQELQRSVLFGTRGRDILGR